MTVTLAPRWALSGLAIRDELSGWLGEGVHLRIIVSPALGFPIHPFLVYPLGMPELGERDMVGVNHWSLVDFRGFPQSLPFEVTPENGLWATLIEPDRTCPFVTITGTDELRVDVIADGPSGPTVVASRSREPWELGGCNITRLRITGRGWVTDLGGIGLEADEDRDAAPSFVKVGLPLTHAALYRGEADADLRADQRVEDDPPARVSLFDDPNDPPGLPVDELARVKVARAELRDWHVKAVSGRAEVVEDAEFVRRVPGPATAKPWTTTTDPTALVLTAALDPGLARWLGLMWTDRTPIPPPPAERAWLYLARAVWAVDVDYPMYAPRFPGDVPPRLIERLPTPQDPDEARAIISQIDDPELTDLFENLPGNLQPVPLTTLVGVALRAEPDLPDAPIVASQGMQGPWRAGVGGGPARRSVVVRVSTPPAGLVGLARPNDQGSLDSLSRLYTEDGPWRRPIVVGRPKDGSLPMEIRDDDAPDSVSHYQVARADPFGRWSTWAKVDAPELRRPPVPIPRLQVTLHPAPDPLPEGDGPEPVRLRIEIAVPLASQVEPGTFPVNRVAVTVDGVESWHNLPVPETDLFVLADVPGPALGRAETGTTRVIARFMDDADRESLPCEPVVRNVRDPRPPPHVVLSGPLNYASRTGRDGQARALLEWDAPKPNVRYRVYLAYEPELRAKLVVSGGTDVVDELDLAAGSGERAAIYFANRTRLPQAAFHVVSGTPIVPSDGRATFEHALPGGLRGLALFKVIPMSEALVEGDWPAAPVAVYAVPDERAPAAPLLRLRVVPTGVEATITVARGTRPVARWRLRRVRSLVTESVFMPIVGSGSVAPPAAGATVDPIVVVDPVARSADAMDRWTYVAEVQGENEDDAVDRSRPTPWSPPSRPASIVAVSTDAPTPVVSATATRSALVAGQVDVEAFHPGRLASDLERPFRLEAYRIEGPGAVPELATTVNADAVVADGGRPPGTDGPFRLSDSGGTLATHYRLVVVDPLDRVSSVLDIPVGP